MSSDVEVWPGVVGVDVIDMVWNARTVDITVADQQEVAAVLSDVAGVRRWLDGVEVACARRLDELAVRCPSMFPEQITAHATRRALRDGARAAARARTADTVTELGAALAAGAVSGEHVDAVTAGLNDLTPPQRRQLAGQGPRLAALASGSTPDEFRREVAKVVRTIQADDGIAKLERQQRAVRLRTWIDKITGMVRFSGEFDPETGLALINRINHQTETLFHDNTPPRCPDDPSARHDFLRAHALLDLTQARNSGYEAAADPGAGDRGGGAGRGDGGRPRWKVEMSIVIDLHTLIHGRHPGSRVDCGIDGIDLPIDTIRRIALYADIIPVLLDEHGVILKMGRTRRLATATQRRALRTMYQHCAIPDCHTPVRQCTPHHCTEWNDGGLTDIELLVPICKHHHNHIHTNGWVLTLSADRCLTITTPNGTTMTTGPPNEQWT